MFDSIRNSVSGSMLRLDVWSQIGIPAVGAAIGALFLATLAKQRSGVSFVPTVVLICTTLFLVLLALYPVPDRAAMQCPWPATTPRLQPFGFVQLFIESYQRRTGAILWLLDIGPASTLMNFGLCAVSGAAAAALRFQPRLAATGMFFLSAVIELTQLTGFWGYLPCAHRQFDVDDLLLNTLGAYAGAVTWYLAQANHPTNGRRQT